MPTPSAPSPAAPVSFRLMDRVKPFFVPYYLAVASVLGGITALFLALFLILVLIVTNFNLLGWME